MITMIMIIVIVIIFFIADLTKIMLVLGYFLMQCSLARLHCPCQKKNIYVQNIIPLFGDVHCK